MAKQNLQRVSVRLRERSSSYEIVIGAGILDHAGGLVRRAATESARRACVISNSTVFSLYGRLLCEGLQRADVTVSHWLMPEGERFKNVRVLERALQFLADSRLERTDLVVALGGGVVGDLAGLASALYLRGISFVQVPTSLLAQIDASVGGKVAVNTQLGKNLIGTFHQPSLVVIDTETLQSLPSRELTAGWCEAIKQGAVAGRSLFDLTRNYLESSQAQTIAGSSEQLVELIAAQCSFKAQIVARDERERISDTTKLSRRILNFGHTVGHALEAVTRFRRFRHGEAVGLGMLAAAEISARLGLLKANELKVLRDIVRLVGKLPRADDLDHRQILKAIATDKKSQNGTVLWVLLAGIGRPKLVAGSEIPARILHSSLRAALGRERRD